MSADTTAIQALVQWSARGFVWAVALIVLLRLITGGINGRGLLMDGDSGGPSALRVQMLLSTVLAAVSYAIAIKHQAEPRLPDVDPRVLALVGATNGLIVVKRAALRLSELVRNTLRART
jgi:hypothetical protein